MHQTNFFSTHRFCYHDTDFYTLPKLQKDLQKTLATKYELMKIDPDCQNTMVEIAFSKNSQKAQSGDHKHARM